MADDIQPDQETYDRLIAAGESERTARAKAKSVAVRRARGANRASLQQGDGQAAVPAAAAEAAPAPAAVATEAPPAAAAPAQAAPAQAAPAQAPAAPAARPAAAPGNGGRRLTPEERAARVAAAVATKGLPGQAGAAAKQGETHRLLAMVPPEGIQRAEARQEDKVNVWPHLLLREAVAAFAMFAFVTVFSMVVNAPLRELANSNLTPNPSKAPWYFLGLRRDDPRDRPAGADGHAVLRQEPVDAAREPQAGRPDVHDVPDVLGHPRAGRLVLPGTELRVGLAVDRDLLDPDPSGQDLPVLRVLGI
jgi:menaquinol-cytochrome c reductase cytochrome b/c subunit